MQIVNNLLTGVTPRGNTFYVSPSPLGMELCINIQDVVTHDFVPRVSAITQDELLKLIIELEDTEYAGERKQTTTDESSTESI